VGTILPNVFGTYYMLELPEKENSGMVFFSSGEVYGRVATASSAKMIMAIWIRPRCDRVMRKASDLEKHCA